MLVISTSRGIVLSFQSIEDFETVVEHLTEQIEWIKKENIQSPFLYSQFDDRIGSDEVIEILENIKSKGCLLNG